MKVNMKMIINLKKKKILKKKIDTEQGSITVFAALVFFMIIVLILTCLEAARVKVAALQTQRALTTSLDATMTQYYRPLYNNYHVFFMDQGLPRTDEKRKIEKYLKEYLNENMSTKAWESQDGTQEICGMQLVTPQIKRVKVDSAVRAVDADGSIFYDAVLQYMKYEATANLILKSKEHFQLMKDCEVTAQVTKKATVANEKLGELGKDVLRVIQAVEGLEYTSKGLKKTRSGDLVCGSFFAKKLCMGAATQSKVGVDNGKVWQATHRYYYDIKADLTSIKNACEELEREAEKKEAQEAEMQRLQAQGQEVPPPAETPYPFLKKIQEVNQSQNTLLSYVNQAIVCNNNALYYIQNLDNKKGEARQTIREYGQMLEGKRGEITEQSFENLQESKTALDQDVNTIETIIGMRGQITQNQAVLEELKNEIAQGLGEDKSQYINKKNKIHSLIEKLKREYKLENLKFSYGRISQEDSSNPVKKIEQLGNGMLSLVVPPGQQISQKHIANADYYLQAYRSNQVSVAEANTRGYVTGENTKGLLQSVKDVFGGENRLKRLLNNGTGTILYQSYVQNYFTNFVATGEEVQNTATSLLQTGNLQAGNGNAGNENRSSRQGNRQENQTASASTSVQNPVNLTKNTGQGEEAIEENLEHALDYEMEYILCGKNTDKKNLQQIVDRLLLIRTVTNMAYLFSDKNKMKQAYMTAVAIVGFTGLEALVRITQFAILAAWAYGESLVDIATLLQGEKIPLIKNSSNFMLQYQDLLTISRGTIQVKARQLAQKNAVVKMQYTDFLHIFMLFETVPEKSYRTMDLIEQNMKKNESEYFSFKDCIYALNVKCKYLVPKKFIAIPFMDQFGCTEEGWEGNCQQSYSY